MNVIQTKIDNATLAKIRLSGKTAYQFLQEAIVLKLEHDTVKSTEVLIDEKLKNQTRELSKVHTNHLEKMEDRLLNVLAHATQLLKESITKDELYKEKTIENLRKLHENIKK